MSRLRRRCLGDDAFSLIEILISVAIMGVAMVAMIGALATQVRGANLHRDQSNAAAVLASAAERVQAATYVACAQETGTYLTAARGATLPSDWVAKGVSPGLAVTITAIKYWNGSIFVASSPCVTDSTDTSSLLQMQLVSIRVSGPNPGDVERLDIVKRAR